MSEEVFDLDAARAAEADASRRPLKVKLGGEVFSIARPLPLAVTFAAAEGDWKGIITGLFGERVDAALAAGLTKEDVQAIFDQLMGGPGKSRKSAGSSPTSGRKSRSTSKSTTD